MTGSRRAWLAFASVAAAAAWLGGSELDAPARLYVVALVALLPALMGLQAAPPDDVLTDLPVEPVYVSSMIVIWGLGIGAVLVGRASGFADFEMGLTAAAPPALLLWAGGITLAAIGIMAVGRRRGWKESALIGWLLPENRRERVLFLLLSVSAGVGEELAYRGFLVPALRMASGSTVLAVAISSAAFGAMHGYQSVIGVVRASALGVMLALPLIFTGSIYPSMAAHALIDVLAGIVLADWLVPGRQRHGTRSRRQD